MRRRRLFLSVGKRIWDLASCFLVPSLLLSVRIWLGYVILRGKKGVPSPVLFRRTVASLYDSWWEYKSREAVDYTTMVTTMRFAGRLVTRDTDATGWSIYKAQHVLSLDDVLIVYSFYKARFRVCHVTSPMACSCRRQIILQIWRILQHSVPVPAYEAIVL